MKNAIRWILLPVIPFIAVAAVELISLFARIAYDVVTTFDFSAPRGFHESRDGLMMLIAMIFEGAAFVWSPHELAPRFKKAVLIVASIFAFVIAGFLTWILASAKMGLLKIAWCIVPFLIGAICATVSILKKGNEDD